MDNLREALGSATLFGGLAVAGCYLITLIALIVFSLSLLTMDISPVDILMAIGSILFLAFVVAVVAVMIVGIANIVVGLPMYLLLREFEWESRAAYCACGAIAGFLVPLTLIAAMDGSVDTASIAFAIPGIVGGGTSGIVWGRWRERAASDQVEEVRYDRGERWLR